MAIYAISFLLRLNEGEVLVVKYSDCRLIIENYVKLQFHSLDSITEFANEKVMRQAMRQRRQEYEDRNNTSPIMLSFEELSISRKGFSPE